LANRARELGILKRPRKKTPRERPPTTSKPLQFTP